MEPEVGHSLRPKRHPRRPYEVVCFEPQEIEKGTDRFCPGEGRNPPTIASWRNSLTALSQHHNLYFVACRDTIHVFEPTPPGQTIGTYPGIIITPVVKNPSAPGFISSRVPHAVNRILVDDIGRDEILVLVTDSGNIVGYRTRLILKALNDAKAQRRKEDGLGLNHGPRDAHVDTFFSEYVGLSAWGVAIHKYARLIAVATNTTYITVFAFALVDESVISDNDDNDDNDSLDHGDDLNLQSQEWMTIQSPEGFSDLSMLLPERRRSRNLRLILDGHQTNIPNISFLNSDLDKEGNWLVSTDIDNYLMVWNIWKQMTPVNRVEFTDPILDHRGWNVLALDPRTFRQATTREEACGGRPVETNDPAHGDLDVSHLIRSIPDVSQAYTYFPPDSWDEGIESDGSFDFGDPVSITTDEGVIECRDFARKETESDSSSDEDNGEGGEISVASPPQEYPDESSPTPHDTNVSNMELETQYQPAGAQGNNLGANLPNNPTFLHSILQEAFGGHISGLEEEFNNEELDEESDDDSSDEGMAETSEPGDDQIDDGDDDDDDNSDGDEDDNDGDDEDNGDYNMEIGEDEDHQIALYNIFSAIAEENGIHDSDQQILEPGEQPPPSNPAPLFLDFPILHFSDTDISLLTNPYSVRPHLLCRRPFDQPFAMPVLSVHACDRINMVHSVPELGVVIAATQKGRVAVITLTHVKSEGLPYFRVDWIAPFASQERFGKRPLHPLVGIAVGPISNQLFQYPSDSAINQSVEMDLKYDLQNRYPDDNQDPENEDMDIDEQPDSKGKGKQPVRPKPANDEKATKVSDDMETDGQPESKDKGKQPAHPKRIRDKEVRFLDDSKNCRYEPWRHDMQYSRRYRLMMMFSDHSVMSYHFYYDWPRRMFSGIPEAYSPEDVILNV
ncbi:hypothetical protein FQN54_008664 [Arachnomyces sp. PD_36]|nr:hypothetical protein FQN54_008664 [Arachnomyces sp. PD_36]